MARVKTRNQLTLSSGFMEALSYAFMVVSDCLNHCGSLKPVRIGGGSISLEPTSHQQREVRSRRANGEPLTEIARSYNVSHSTISRLPF